MTALVIILGIVAGGFGSITIYPEALRYSFF